MAGEGNRPELYAEERRAAILSMLNRSSSVQVAEVADAFGVSRVTARADLDALERDGKLRRTHGGPCRSPRRSRSRFRTRAST